MNDVASDRLGQQLPYTVGFPAVEEWPVAVKAKWQRYATGPGVLNGILTLNF